MHAMQTSVTTAHVSPLEHSRLSHLRSILTTFARNHKIAAVAGIFLFVLSLAVAFAPQIAPYDPNQISLRDRLLGPSLDHYFGTDESGRDNFSRVLYGGRISLVVGLAAMVISIALGTVLGLIAGFRGGIVDAVIMRAT
ncbi:MAG: ABC transporter permease, partial [Thermomicrobiales bacterium]|nr:ABC transporter permease [Thermomicrobiales bacterium]